jgi:hypothetical protein
MPSPVWIAAVMLVALVVVAASTSGRRRRVTPPSPAAERNRQWARSVAPELVPAVKRAQLATVASKESHAPLKYQSVGPIGTIGWTWKIVTPGGATIADMRAKLGAISSAINDRRPLVAMLELRGDPVHEGHGWLDAYRVDPIHAVRPISEVAAPGERLMPTPTASMLVGVTRRGKRTRLPLHKASMLTVGQTQRGKSSAVHTVIANLLPHVADGTARLRFIDLSVKQGRGYRWLNADGWFHSWATTPGAAFKVLDDMAAELAARGDDGSDSELRITRRTPLDVLIIEEAPAFLDHKRDKQSAAGMIEDLARQVAAIGGVIILVSQGAKEVPMTLRRTLPTRVAFGLADNTESHNAFDSASFEGGADGPHTIPKTDGRDGTVDWRGVSYVDDDGTGVHMVRWWYVPPAWLKAHAAALRPARTGAR